MSVDDATSPDDALAGWSILHCPDCQHRIVAHKSSRLLHHGEHGHTVVPVGMHANSIRPPRLT